MLELSKQTFNLKNGEGIDFEFDVFSKKNHLGVGILFVHGGGFVGGDKTQFESLATFLAKNCNILASTINYTLPPKAHFPVQVKEIIQCSKFLKAEFHLSELILSGGSPGANIAAVAVGHEKEKNDLSFVKSLILLNPILDLELFLNRNEEEHANVLAYLGSGDFSSKVTANSPFKHLENKNYFLLYGEEDNVTPPSEGEAFLRKRNQSENLFLFKNQGHGWFNDRHEQKKVAQVMEKIINFNLKETL